MRNHRILLLVAFLGCLALAPAAARAADDPFSGAGMWIWQVPRAAGGDPVAIAAQAQASGIDTLFIKGADGTQTLSQFTPALVSALKADGLNVCAYQRLRGRRPGAEAAAAARAIGAGADCFVIDAESELEGRYRQARAYVKALRKRIGADFPVGFTSFPYLSLHPLEPVSVFLGPGGAKVNLPQIYWKSIGNSPRAAFARTVADNRVYGAPLAPIGQLYSRPSRRDVRTFRRLALAYDVLGVSWWSWENARPGDFRSIAPMLSLAPVALPATTPSYPTVRPGARSDYVVWAKDHLRDQGFLVTRDTRLDRTTVRAVQAFQAQAGLPATGTLDTATWTALLAQGSPS